MAPRTKGPRSRSKTDAVEDLQAKRAGASWPLLDGSADDGLVTDLPASPQAVLVGRADVRLVDFDQASQAIPSPVREGRAELVQQGPRGPVARQAAVALELQGRDPLLVARQEEDRKEPDLERNPSAMQHRPRRDRCLVATAVALLEPAGRDPRALPVAAARAPEAVGPASAPQRQPAVLLALESRLELDQCLRKPHGSALLRAAESCSVVTTPVTC